MTRKPGQWWDRSWSLVSGCSWPEGERPRECEHCWMREMVRRFPSCRGSAADLPWETVRCHPERLGEFSGRGWAKVWLASIQGDLGHPDVPQEFVWQVLDHARRVNWLRDDLHRVVMLTKRPRRLSLALLTWALPATDWLMLAPSAGTCGRVVGAIGELRGLHNIALRGLHLEPLLEDVASEIGESDRWLAPPDWIVVGAENGPGARPCDPDWVRRIRDWAGERDVPFWLKGLGPGKGRELDGRTHDEMPRWGDAC